jgi:hypothetical protein
MEAPPDPHVPPYQAEPPSLLDTSSVERRNMDERFFRYLKDVHCNVFVVPVPEGEVRSSTVACAGRAKMPAPPKFCGTLDEDQHRSLG